MAYTHPTYPTNCSKAYWDKNKGIVAKMAGETGVGAAAKTAEDCFRKIDWRVFDIVARAPMATTKETLAEVRGYKNDVVTEWNKTVKPTIAALRKLSDAAGKAAKSFKANKAIPKSATQIAEEISKASDLFGVALELNSIFFDQVAKEIEIEVAAKEKAMKLFADIAARTGEFLDSLIAGLKKVVDNPTMKAWDSEVKQQGRSVSNNLKANPELAKKYLKTWTKKFQGFDWSTLGFSELQGEELKSTVKKFASEVFKESQILRKDLNG